MRIHGTNISLEKLCRQPDMYGKPVVAISASRLDKIKVSIGTVENSNGEYIESKKFVTDKTDHAINFAKQLADCYKTNFIYEIRVFNDGSSECIRIFRD